MSAREMLDTIAKLRWEIIQLETERDNQIAQRLPQDVRAWLNNLERTTSQGIELLETRIQALTAEVREEVVRFGESAKGQSGLIATYQPGRVTWDTKALDQYAESHPEIAAFKRVGEPFVTISKK